MYTVTASVRMQCRDQNNRFMSAETRQYSYNFDLNSADEDYTDQLFALVENDLPDGCRVLGGISTAIAPAAFSTELPLASDGAPIYGPTVDNAGQLITIYAVMVLQCRGEETEYRTVLADVPITATRDEVLDAIHAAIASAIANGSSSLYDCRYAGFTVTAPAMYQYLRE